MNVTVSSVSKTEQPLSHTAAAAFVISAEDIRRSGAINIPDLLRMVPGVDVAQINANTWAISARGLNGHFSNELLVMVDGRKVYTPTFGGVLWDALDLPLEDIERIEVIRGPGGSVWGVNAVNGVINIVTRKASETKGGLVVLGGGNLNQGFGTVQYGGRIGKHTDYRMFAKYFNQSHLKDPNGVDGGDGWSLSRGGFRTDSDLSANDTLMVQGDLYGGDEGVPARVLTSITESGPHGTEIAAEISGGFIQSVWHHVISPRADTSLQMSYDRYVRHDLISERRGTFSIDFQHHFAIGGRQDIVWGGDYSFTDSHTIGGLSASFNPANRISQPSSAFFQDEIALIPSKLYVTLGTKLEHNSYTGFGWMPSARVAWAPSTHHMFWVASSKADRIPSETDTSVRADVGSLPGPGGTIVLLAVVGNPRFKDEKLRATEVGYRVMLSNHLSIDLATYYNIYTSQQTNEPATPFFENTPAPAHLVAPVTFANLSYGESHGVEIALNLKPIRRWTLSPGYAFERIHMHLDKASQDTGSTGAAEGSSPTNAAQLRSRVELLRKMTWDTSAYFVGRLLDGNVPSYARVDTGFTFSLTEGLSLNVTGQNLLQPRHVEFVDEDGTVRSNLAGRSVFAKLTWKF